MKKVILLLSIITTILFTSCKECEVYVFNKKIEKKHKHKVKHKETAKVIPQSKHK